MAQNEEIISAIRNANPIEIFINSYINLKKQGRVYKCQCPFHSDRTPSFTVFPDTQSFYCFGCGAGGDIITFTMKYENLDFTEAVKMLAEKSGLQISEKNSRNSTESNRRTRIYEMNRIAANFFYSNLVQDSSKSGLKYFYDRKLSPQIIKKYGLGYAPDSWNALTDMLISKGYSEQEIIDAWLGGRSKNGKIFDMFRNRVIFPIVDLRGNVIGFGGRVLDDSKPKYLNTSNTPVFNKGKNLFSLNFARKSDSKRLILCEGYMDVIALVQAGFDNAVATLGTAITPEQARTISRYSEEVIIAYDSDTAGQTAARKAIGHFADTGVSTRILHMEGAKDPDEYIKKFGADRFRRLLDGSEDANNFMLDKCETGLDISTEAGKVELLKRVSRYIADMKSSIEREVYISRVSAKYNFPADVLKSHIDNLIRMNISTQKKQEWNTTVKSQTSALPDKINPEAVKFKKEANAEEFIICYLLRFPENLQEIENEAPADIFVTSFYKKVYTSLLNAIRNNNNFSVSLLNNEFSVDEMGRIIGITARHRELIINKEVFTECTGVLKNHRNLPINSDISDDDLRSMFNAKKH